MSIFRFLKRIVPNSFRRQLREYIIEAAAPHIIYGYRDSTGILRPKTRLSNTVVIHNRENVKIEDNVFVGHFVILDGTKSLEIGEGTQISAWVGIFTHSSHNAIRLYGKHYLDIPEEKKKAYHAAPVKIGKYVYIGSKSLILSGVEIGDGALIAAGSIVTKNVSPFSLVMRDGTEVTDGARQRDIKILRNENDPQLEEWYREWQNSIRS